MQQTPGFDHRPVKTMKERDCPHCLYYDQKAKKCGLKACTVFKDWAAYTKGAVYPFGFAAIGPALSLPQTPNPELPAEITDREKEIANLQGIVYSQGFLLRFHWSAALPFISRVVALPLKEP